LAHLASGRGVEGDAQPDSREKVSHDVHVDNDWGIRQEISAVCQQRGSHQFQD
jgi:hypothetical protein